MYKNEKVSVIIAAAGSGKRMGTGRNKQYIMIGGMPVLARSVLAFENADIVDEIIISVRENERDMCASMIVEQFKCKKVIGIVAGGDERPDSVWRALQTISDNSGIVLIHDGARPFVSQELIENVVKSTFENGAAIPVIRVKDTIKVIDDAGDAVERTLERAALRAVQTPQGFKHELIYDAYLRLNSGGLSAAEPKEGQSRMVTDDAYLIEQLGKRVAIVEGEDVNIKITTPHDIKLSESLLNGDETEMKVAMPDIRTGFGMDVHAFAENRDLILGGVKIPFDRGLLGHSDADVLIHAIMDSLLGAAGLGDIGRHFPDTDEAYRGISSLKLLEKTRKLLAEDNWQVANIDAVLVLQKPKIAPYIEEMKSNISKILNLEAARINIKGTTTEKLGFAGREEGVEADAVSLIMRSETFT